MPRTGLLLPVGLVAVLTASTLLVGRPAVAAPSSAVDTAAAAVQAQLRADGVPVAAFAVVRDGRTTTGARGAGTSETTPFVLGSISKSFTALAVLQLVDAGRVDLDAPVTRYLADFRTADPDAVITVRQLLTQTSGLRTSAGVAIVDHPETSLADRVRGASQVRLVSPPGRTFHYSNLNYAVLGRVVEQVSQLSFGEYLQRNVFDPLDMTGSSASLTDARAEGLPPAATVWFGATIARSTPDYPGGAPDGFLVSTARDMSRYLRFQLGDGTDEGTRIVSEASLRAMHTATTGTPPDVAAAGTDAYAMGWGVGDLAGQPLLAHDGDVIGYHANAALLPDSHASLVVLTARNGALTDANAPATAGVTVLAGGDLREPSRTFLHTYLVVDTISAVLLVALVTSLVRRSWRRRLADRIDRRGPWRGALVPIAANLLAAVGVYAGVFRVLASATVGFPVSLRFAVGFIAPDVSLLVLLVCGFFLSRALVVLTVLRRSRRR